MEAREHDDEEGRHVEEEEAREEGAQPGKCEQGRADKGEVKHRGGGLHGHGHRDERGLQFLDSSGETFMVAREEEREEMRWPRETTELQTWGAHEAGYLTE